MTPERLAWCAALALASCGAGLVLFLASFAPRPRPLTGLRGAERQKALASRPDFALLEPLVRLVAAWMLAFRERTASLSPQTERLWRRVSLWQERQLLASGTAWGLDVDETLALSAMSALASGALGVLLAAVSTKSPLWFVPAALLGAALPNLQLSSLIAVRAKVAARTLPGAIDIAALCMSAGADFPQALRLISQRSEDLVARELAHMLGAMEVGLTRRVALEELALRLPSPAVQELVRALISADEKGSPLASVLKNQARMSRMRRSVLAEEAAARAGVLMVVPLMLLMGTVLLLLLGPFLVKGGGL